MHMSLCILCADSPYSKGKGKGRSQKSQVDGCNTIEERPNKKSRYNALLPQQVVGLRTHAYHAGLDGCITGELTGQGNVKDQLIESSE